MPNHTQNVIRFEGDNLEQIQTLLAGKNGLVDFNSLVPMPDGLDIDESSDGKWGLEILRDDPTLASYLNIQWIKDAGVTDVPSLKEFLINSGRANLDLAREYIENEREHGFRTWYGWSTVNWGTKWNAYSIDTAWTERDGYIQISFNTAWAYPEPIIDRLREICEERGIELTHFYSDEDGGSTYDPVTDEWVTVFQESD